MKITHIAATLLVGGLLAACGTADAAAPSGDDPVGAPIAGMCHVSQPDCVDTDFGDGGDEFDSGEASRNAEAQLGLAENELAPDVRIGRRGDEHMMLTEDYVLGRLTVELDADDDGTYRVVTVTVELPEGPQTFTTD